MKKTYSIVNGNIAFYIFISIGILCFIIGCVLIPSPDCAGPFGFTGFILVLLLIMYNLKYLNYVRIGEVGIEHKKHIYSWDEIKFTVSYAKYGISNYVYRFYFDSKYLDSEDERKVCKRNGQFIDINKLEKMELILQYYKKEVVIFKECPYGKKLKEKIDEHNKAIKGNIA